ncbi:CoA ester lyase [Paraburkholderia sp. RL18-103-BIB-C]|uniref:HpcH/HpaI aldolase/citrate lyase family protein n=1 Tax=Paraburkholderia sp. RL18-103-BIB-C TaxID=3031637 RepID=UPI0038BC10D4
MSTATCRASVSSLLFVPGDRFDRFDKAVATGASGVILDLEDAVAPQNKAAAREAIFRWLSSSHAESAEIIVRINGTEAQWHDEDLRFVSELPSSVTIMCPKSEPDTVRDIARRIDGRHALYALVETVAGVLGLRDMATVMGLDRFAFGNVDFGVDAGITVGDEEMELAAVRTMFVLESRLAGLPAPVDGVSLELRDQARISEHAARAKRFGFGGKLCIHPAQVRPVNAMFGPSAAEIEWARIVLEKFGASGGSAVAHDGEMIDRPVAERAARILASVPATR